MDSNLFFLIGSLAAFLLAGILIGLWVANRRPRLLERIRSADFGVNLVDVMQFAHVTVDAVEQIATRDDLTNPEKLHRAIQLLKGFVPELDEFAAIAAVEAAIYEKKDDEDEDGEPFDVGYLDGREAFEKMTGIESD